MASELKVNPFENLLVTVLLILSALAISGCAGGFFVGAMPSPKGNFVIYEDKYKSFNYDNFNFKKNDVAVDVSFKYDWFVDNSPNHKKFFVKFIMDNLRKSNLFSEVSIVEPDEYENEYKVTFLVDRINHPIFKDFAMLPIVALTFNNYDHWQEHRFIIETKIYQNGKLIKEHEHKKSYYSSIYWFAKPEPKFSDYSEIYSPYVESEPPTYLDGLDSFYDELAFDVIKDLATEKCFVTSHRSMN